MDDHQKGRLHWGIESILRARSVSDSKSNTETIGGDNFYQEVDERMSRNSIEYPEHQARYIDSWFKSNNFHSLEADDSLDRGNVIGIRGFLSENFIAESNRQRECYNKLKYDYLKLQSDYKKVCNRLDETSLRLKSLAKKKDHDIELLKSRLVSGGRHKQQTPITQPACESCSKLHKDQEEIVKVMKAENEKLQSQLNNKSNEVDTLRRHICNLSLEATNRTLLELHNENVRLKDMNGVGFEEFNKLKEYYYQLEGQLKGMTVDQKCLDDERNEEAARLMVELCRLQVYQPKLEMIIETEQQIKAELQCRIDGLHKDNEELKEKVSQNEKELQIERMRSKGCESSQMAALQDELVRYQEKLERVRKEKGDLEELLRSSKSRIASLDGRVQCEIDLVKEASRRELDDAKSMVVGLETERNSLEARVGSLCEKLKQCELDKHTLNREIESLHKQLELSAQKCDEETTVKIDQLTKRAEALQNQLDVSESRNKDLSGELAASRSELGATKRQLDEMRRRFELQQRAMDELKEMKDQEVARLRVELNFEKYNRQVALKAIEKELKSSLRELEAMKYRFTKRLNAKDDCIVRPVGRVQFVSGSCLTDIRPVTTLSNKK